MASYIKKFAWSNAKTEDLWAVLEGESGEPVKILMESWTKQKGYPVVYVKINDGKLELEQVCKFSSLLKNASLNLLTFQIDRTSEKDCRHFTYLIAILLSYD